MKDKLYFYQKKKGSFLSGASEWDCIIMYEGERTCTVLNTLTYSRFSLNFTFIKFCRKFFGKFLGIVAYKN